MKESWGGRRDPAGLWMLDRVAADISVLVRGESGTGKERRRPSLLGFPRRAFVALNVAAILRA